MGETRFRTGQDRDAILELLSALAGPPVRYPRGSVLFSQDAPAENVFVIETGFVKHVRAEPSGRGDVRDVILALRRAPAPIGLTAALTEGAHLSTAVVVEPCSTRVVPTRRLLEAVDRDPAVGRLLLRLMSEELSEQIRRAGIAALPGHERLERFLAYLVQTGFTLDRPAGTHVRLPIAVEEVGQMIGLSRQQVHRLLTKLADKGLIERHANWIVIPSSSRLRKIR